jgi:hypothetical protein
MIIFKRAVLLSLMLLVTACSSDISDYESTGPIFDIKNYFNGEFVGWGMVQDYSSKVTRRFCVELNGTWQNNQGKLEEVFYFHDGEVSYRTWLLTKRPNDKYTGTAEDVVGIAKGKQTGHAFRWQYQLVVPIDEDTYTFDMDDWMYLLDDNRVMNKTTMSKLGVDLAQITLFFDKSVTTKKCQ